MGNAQSSTFSRTTGALDSYVTELGGDIVYDRSIGSARFLKTVKCRHRNGPLVVKIYVKPDPGLSLRNYHRRLKLDREALIDIPNVYNYQTFAETDKAGYIIRQWIASNLYDRISTRPFLSTIEKKWIAFQVITALREARNRKVSHGDIKSENILVTSWNWVYVTDFASFKPTYLPLDDPSEFSYYFDTSGRRTCYIAPERFYTAVSNPEISAKKSRIALDDGEARRDGKLTEAMDCFSVGCVVAELFLEGAPLFTLSQLFKYRSGEYSVENSLNAIDDVGVRDMIRGMITLDPNARPTFDSVLHTSRGTVFPESFFNFLHNYVASIGELPVNSPFNNHASNTGATTARSVSRTTTDNLASIIDSSNTLLPSDSDHRIERIWADYESVEPYLVPDSVADTVTGVRIEEQTFASASKPFQDILPVELYIPNRESTLRPVIGPPSTATEDGPSLIILALVTSNIRNCTLPSSKIRALDVLLSLAGHLTDEAKLDRMVPYIVELLHDDAAIVRSGSFRTLIQVLMMVTVITPSNAAIFPEYIIPNIKYLIHDPEVSVRCTYAQCMAHLAETASRYLEMGQALRAHGTFKLAPEGHDYEQAHFEISYDASLQDLQNSIEEQLSALLMDPSSIVKRAVLHNISYLCVFLKAQKTNDVVLSHMITYLNDRDWHLRYAFFDSIVDVATCARGRSLEEYILPLMIQALSDVEETVVAKVLTALTQLCELDLFPKMRVWELMSATLNFLHHPNTWIRQGATAFIASAANHLPPSDVWCILYPSLRFYLTSDVVAIDKFSLLSALKPPLSRHIFDAAVQWAMKNEKSSFWRGSRRISKTENPRDSMISNRKVVSKGKSEEDEIQLAKLRHMGMTSSDEGKLAAMADYINKLSNAISSFTTRSNLEIEQEKNLRIIGDIELTKLGVVPLTVFLKARASDTVGRRVPTRQSSIETLGKAIALSPPRAGRLHSSDSNSGSAPFEDLRRRLATINASNSSISLNQAQRDNRLVSPILAPTSSLLGAQGYQPDDRPSSPTESVVSTANSSSFRPLTRLQAGGTDKQKAAPAIGSSKTNVKGFLDSHSKIYSEGSSEKSGRNSPISMSNTLRVPSRQPSSIPISSYDGQEPGINNLLENLYLDNNRELQHDFGPKVRDGPVRRRNPVRPTFTSRDEGNRKLESTLVAHLTSHSECITGLAVSPDHLFFVSVSDDKTVKVWDTARLERNVTSKPRHTYGQHHARVKCVCIIEGSHCFASAADDGSLHVVRVHVTQSGALPKYGKLQVVREHRVEIGGDYITCMAHFNTDTSSNLVYTTSQSSIVTLDLRTMQVTQILTNPRHHGSITCLCIDRKKCWLLVGTSSGTLTLWDRRLGLRLKSWYVGIASTGRSVRIHQCVVHPSKGKGKWVMVTVGTTIKREDASQSILVEIWDIEKSVLVETLSTRVAHLTDPIPDPHEVTGVDSNASPSTAIAALVRSRQHSANSASQPHPISPPSNSVRAVAVGLDFGGHSSHRLDNIDHGSETKRGGYILTGSEDRKIRFWDLGKPERSSVLSGLDTEQERPSYSTVVNGSAATYVETCPPVTGTSSMSNRAPQRISLVTNNQHNLLKSHQDVITSLVSIESPFRGGIVSGDRSGTIKVWKVELGDA